MSHLTLSKVELPVAALLLLAVGIAVWGSHVREGGFYWADDWFHAQAFLHGEGGLRGLFNSRTADFRPMLGVLLSLPYRAFGLRTELHLALGLGLSVAASAAFYALLRTLSVGVADAGALATLSVLFPWSDATRLWAAASLNNVAVIFYFVGLALALRGLTATGRRRRVLVGASLTLYVLGVLTYEVVGAAAALSVLVYGVHAGWRAALRRWPLDLALVVPALAFVWAGQPGYHRYQPTLSTVLDRAGQIAAQAAQLGLQAVFPVGRVAWLAGSTATGALLGAAVVLVAGAGLAGGLKRRSRQGMVMIAAGASAIAVAYAPFAPALDKYVPGAQGLLNRVNLLAGFGFALLVYGLVVMVATGLSTVARRGPLTAGALTGLLTALIGVGYVAQAARDKRDWALAWQLQRQQLELTAALLPRPPAGAVIYTFGAPNYVAPGVPVFALAGDLRNAVKVTFRDPELTGYPMRGSPHHTRWVCEKNFMYPLDWFFGPPEGAPYGRGVFVSVPERRAVVIRDEGQCREWSGRFHHPAIPEFAPDRAPLLSAGPAW